MMQPNSPNWYWHMMGFTVHREGLYRRTVFDTHGHIVCKNAGYDTELAISEWLYHGAII